jgi:pyridoxal phosphate enzyme (YggS family)
MSDVDLPLIANSLAAVRAQIEAAEQRAGREPGSVQLLAVSKTKPAEAVEAAFAAGQRMFGENQLQDALPKVTAMAGRGAEWHFIGPVQGNKTRQVAEHFDWVQSIDRDRIVRRLSDHRPEGLAPLNVCIQFNVSGEQSKSGATADELPALCELVAQMPNLSLRGLMAIPAPSTSEADQRAAFAQVRETFENLQARGFAIDTLSMGMSGDIGAAIAEGATMVRVGTAVFGGRP